MIFVTFCLQVFVYIFLFLETRMYIFLIILLYENFILNNLRLLKKRNLLFVIVSNVGEIFAPLSINRIRESRMVAVQLRSIGENLIRKFVQIPYPSWKPRYSSHIVVMVSDRYEQQYYVKLRKT